MSPDEFRAIREAFGLKDDAMAKLLNVQGGRTVRKWEGGERSVSGPVIVLLTACLAVPALAEYLGVKPALDAKAQRVAARLIDAERKRQEGKSR